MSTRSAEEKLPPPDASGMRVGVAFDIGGRGDASFNDATVAGLERAKAAVGIAEVKELDAGAGESEAASRPACGSWPSRGSTP